MAAVGGAALATPAGVVKGEPQPELRPFSIGAANSNGTVAMEPDGRMVVAYDIASGNGKTQVCLLRGGSQCSQKVTLSPLSNDFRRARPARQRTRPRHAARVG